MIFIQSFKMAIKSLMGAKMRAFLTMLGIIIGVAAVIVLVSLVSGMTKDMLSEFEAMGANLITVSVSGRGGSSRSVNMNDMYAIYDANTDLLTGVSPNVSSSATAKIADSLDSLTVNIIGCNEMYADMRGLNIEYGRSISYLDCKERLYNCIIGTYQANYFFGNAASALGQKLNLNGYSFTVIGVLEETEDSSEGSSDDTVLLPYPMAQKLNENYKITSYYFTAVTSEKANACVEVLKQALYAEFEDEDAYRVSSMQSIISTIDEMTATLSMILAGIAGISLLVGGIGIMNIMLVSVTERTREIGIRKSLGATPFAIMSQFVVEAVATSVMGGLLGILIGIAASYATAFFDLTVSISGGAILLSFSVSAIIGITFGYFPAKKASKLNPIEALRHD